jgi:hypothetical protein
MSEKILIVDTGSLINLVRSGGSAALDQLLKAGHAGRVLCIFSVIWLRGPDLNRRPSGYEPDELPGCSTPR